MTITAVTPCFQRQSDLDAVTADLARVAEALAEDHVRLALIAVDNASDPPLALNERPPGAHPPDARLVRLATNTGGSGGYNAGLSEALLAPNEPPDAVWRGDSDARVTPETLRALVRVLRADETVVAAGSAVAWPTPAEAFEVGGVLDLRTGAQRGHTPTEVTPDTVGAVDGDYAAACSLLVRAPVARDIGLMPDVFLNGDAAAWCLRMERWTGGRVVAVPDSVVVHPRFDRPKGWPRYYAARNGYLVIEASGLGAFRRARARFARTLIESARAAGQHAIGRPHAAAWHQRGLADGLSGRWPTVPPAELNAQAPTTEPARWDDLAERLPEGVRTFAIDPALQPQDAERATEALQALGLKRRTASASTLAGLWRAAARPAADVGVVSSKGRPSAWGLGRSLIIADEAQPTSTTPGGFGRLTSTLAKGALLAVRAGARAPRVAPNAVPQRVRTGPLTLSVIVLNYNREAALRRTLPVLLKHEPTRSAEIIVVDNASRDASLQMLAGEFPNVRTLALPENLGVEAFNRGVGEASGDVVLILDDDAWPEPEAASAAMDALTADPSLGAVTLHPRHPETDASEWPFAEQPRAKHTPGFRRDWPVMGCGNFVRREVWRALGGYEPSFFLYRNDADLALKVLGAGLGVGFHPDWVVRHDSPAAARKSPRWFRTATRNWVWMCRRHGRRGSGLIAALAGWAWAHRLAGVSVTDHARALQGGLAGLFKPPPPTPPTVAPDGAALRVLLGLRRGGAYAPPAATDTTSDNNQRHSA